MARQELSGQCKSKGGSGPGWLGHLRVHPQAFPKGAVIQNARWKCCHCVLLSPPAGLHQRTPEAAPGCPPGLRAGLATLPLLYVTGVPVGAACGLPALPQAGEVPVVVHDAQGLRLRCLQQQPGGPGTEPASGTGWARQGKAGPQLRGLLAPVSLRPCSSTREQWKHFQLPVARENC